MRCKHDYDIIDKTVLKSGFEQVVETGQVITDFECKSDSNLFNTKVVYVFKCRLCGCVEIRERENP